MSIKLKLAVESFTCVEYKNYKNKKVSALNQFRYLIFLTFIMLLPAVSLADTHTAATCSFVDVVTAYTAAANGDTVAIPAGNCTWTSSLTVTKPITIQGAGGSSTIITHNVGSGNSLFIINPSSGNENSLIRITGIYFNHSSPAQYLNDVVVNGKILQLRIDNNTFNKGGENIRTSNYQNGRRTNGVIDNNTFIDTNNAIRITEYADFYNVAPTESSWGRALSPGGTDNLFIETNTFTTGNFSGCEKMNEYVYHMNGARTIIRYNTFNNACPGTDTQYDAHGLAGTDRGTRFSEIYANTWNFNTYNKWLNLRGGSYLIYDNNVNVANGSPYIRFRNENFEYFGDTAWPSTDQIHNTFIWNNKVNGQVVTNPVSIESGQGTFFQEGRDYWLHAPQASGGKTTFGSVPGLSNRDCYSNGYMKLPNYSQYTEPASCCTGSRTGSCSMTFSSGANAYYPYTPYTYPHPLTLRPLPGEVPQPRELSEPKNVRIQ